MTATPTTTTAPRDRAPARGPRVWAPLLALALGFLAPHGAAQEEVMVRRFADLVAVRQGEMGRERVLYYFSPTASLAVGDEVQQGGGAHAELSLSAAGRVEFHDPTHLVVLKLHPEGDVLRFTQLTRATATSGDRVLALVLPNGARCVLDGARVELTHEFGRLRVRNTGALPVTVRGAMELKPGMTASPQSLDKIVLAKGEEVRMPYFGEPSPLDQPQVTDWSDRTVRHDDAVAIRADGARLDISAERDAELRVAGVRTRLTAGQVLVVHDRRAPATPPAPADTP